MTMVDDEKPGIGHNSGDQDSQSDLEEILGDAEKVDEAESSKGATVGGVAGEQLHSFIERIERLEEEKAALQADIREVYAEAKSSGFEPKIMRRVVRLRKMDKSDRQEEAALMDLYCQALGI